MKTNIPTKTVTGGPSKSDFLFNGAVPGADNERRDGGFCVTPTGGGNNGVPGARYTD